MVDGDLEGRRDRHRNGDSGMKVPVVVLTIADDEPEDPPDPLPVRSPTVSIAAPPKASGPPATSSSTRPPTTSGF